jgi:Glycosyl hydrolase family 76
VSDLLEDAWTTLERTAFRRSIRGLSVRETTHARGRATLWTLVHVLWAACDLHDLGRTVPVTELADLVERYRADDAYAATQRGRIFFDDNAWLGLVLLRVARATAREEHHARARDLIHVVRAGEDPRGGVRWAEHTTTRNTCSTAAAGWLALLAGGPDDAAFAARVIQWLVATLRGPDDLFADRIDDAAIEPTVWSYNQGAAVAALRLLARNADADRTAAASLDTFRGPRRWTEPPPFLAIWFRALVSDPLAGTGAIRSLREHVDQMMRHAFDDATGRFTRGGIGSYDGRTTIDHAAAIELLALRERTSARSVT